MSQCDGIKPCSPLQQSTRNYMRLAGLSETTQESYIRELTILSRFYGQSPADLSTEQLEQFLLAGIDRGLAPRSTNVTVSAMKMLYANVLKCPERVESLSMRKVRKQLPKSIDEGKIETLILATHNIKYRTAIKLAYATGLRISEVVKLKVSDIDSKQSMIHVACGKGGHERTVFMPDCLLETMRDYYRQIYPKPVEWLFYGAEPAKPLTTATLRSAFNQARDAAGIGKDFTFHGLRHSMATHLLARGARREEVQDILGHDSPKSTQVYARTTAATFNKLDHPAQHLLS